ncbi:hypothetical protein AMAG_02560 [Allomyces macrogynus ATCC 38327]|uniref:MoxR domain-containing protein n=1 Tax=Allomyces macrogynus (strain ATCC 38327) TaxID=578462 RepID=A0A0L0S2M2_ALLM3|nr:hypothetical protein AMAG_02560 [Allomyces macrogynus ATCC 38327]|eukprot:KNE56788.1 hypothetical protein AMAG_02560 [Allomyces macrogynus ATCC 38327]
MSSTTGTPLPSPPPVHAKAKKVIDVLNDGLVDRDECIRVLLLGLLTGQNVLVLGPPGTAKSKVVTDLFNRVEATNYKNVLHASISPETLVGPVDLELLKTKSQISVNTKGMLPTGQLVFLDEIFKASRNVLSILLSILNERIFVNGPISQAVPLHFAVGASNEVFLDPAQSPLLDRFPLRVLVDGLDVAKRRELTMGIPRKRPHRDYLIARAAAAKAAKAAEQNQSKLDDEFVAPSDPEKINLVADIFAMLDAVDSKKSDPLPEDVQALLFALVDYANRLDLTGTEAKMPKTHTTRTQEVYCGDVITNRGVVMFTDMLRIMAYLHGRAKSPCIFDLYPLVYMAWRTNDQRTTITAHIVAALIVALPELVVKHGAAWAYAAIRDHLFVPKAVKAVLVSHLLADMIRAGLGDEALEALTQQPLVDPSVNESAAIRPAVLLGHAGLLTRLRVDDRVKDTMPKWDKDAKKLRDEMDAQKAAEAKRIADDELAKRRADAMPIAEAEIKRLQKLQLEKQRSELKQKLAVSEQRWKQRKDDFNNDNQEIAHDHNRRHEAMKAKLASAGIGEQHPSFDGFVKNNEHITHGMWAKRAEQEKAAGKLESEEREAMHQLIAEVEQKLAAL